jgi:hypothetical protein
MKAATMTVLIGSLAAAGDLDTTAIERATELKGSWNAEEGVFKVTAPRTDVRVAVDGSPLLPFQGLTSWAAFKKGAKAPAMVMGDLVVFEDEVDAVLDAALGVGLSVTALHNHFFFDQPKVCFMHIAGEGPEAELGKGVRLALDAAGRIRANTPAPASSFGSRPVPSPSSITASKLEELLGLRVQAKEGMAKAIVGRTVKAACGCEAGREMGVNSWAAFAGTDADAVMDGDIAMREEEITEVLKALRGAGLHPVAIHHHMAGETPRMLFVHFWGRGPAAELAGGFKGALSVLK